jgi:hypothetical protein
LVKPTRLRAACLAKSQGWRREGQGQQRHAHTTAFFTGLLPQYIEKVLGQRGWKAKNSIHTIDTSVYQAGEEVSVGFSMVAIPSEKKKCFGLSTTTPILIPTNVRASVQSCSHQDTTRHQHSTQRGLTHQSTSPLRGRGLCGCRNAVEMTAVPGSIQGTIL